MKKRFKKVIAVLCAIALVVSTVTVYNAKDVKAVDWSDTSGWTEVISGGNSYKITHEGTWVQGFQAFAAGTYLTTDALWCNFSSAEYTKVIINGTEYASSNHLDMGDTVRFMGAQCWWAANLMVLKQNTVEFYSGDTLKEAVYVYNANGLDEIETTTRDPNIPTEEPTTPDPWKSVTNSSTIKYQKSGTGTVTVAPQIEGAAGSETVYMALGMAAVFSSVTLNGVALTPSEGAYVRLNLADLNTGAEKYELVIKDHHGTQSVTFIFWNTTEEAGETTTPDPDIPTEEPTTPKPAVPTMVGNPKIELSNFGQGDVIFVAGLDLILNANTYNLYVDGEIYGTVTNGANIEVSNFEPGTHLFQVTGVNDAGESNKSPGYTITIPEVQNPKPATPSVTLSSTVDGQITVAIATGEDGATYAITINGVIIESGLAAGTYNYVGYLGDTEYPVEVVATLNGVDSDAFTGNVTVQLTKYTVTVDGQVLADDYTYGDPAKMPTDAAYGYYAVVGDDAQMIQPGKNYTVTADADFVSVNQLDIEVAGGAGIRVDGKKSGLRFQTTITTDQIGILDQDENIVTAGTLITANDLFVNKGECLDLESNYTYLNIKNVGWYNGNVGTYCGSIVDIIESNYIREFIATAYATINYTNGATETFYSGLGQEQTGAYSQPRSIKYVATAYKNDPNSNYNELEGDAKAMVDSYINAK